MIQRYLDGFEGAQKSREAVDWPSTSFFHDRVFWFNIKISLVF